MDGLFVDETNGTGLLFCYSCAFSTCGLENSDLDFVRTHRANNFSEFFYIYKVFRSWLLFIRKLLERLSQSLLKVDLTNKYRSYWEGNALINSFKLLTVAKKIHRKIRFGFAKAL